MSQALNCSAGHVSAEADFCSVCGVEMAGAAATPATAATAGTAGGGVHQGEDCPKCKAEREDVSSPFCGTCGYNFVTRVGGDVIQAAVPASALVAIAVIPLIPVSVGNMPGARMDIVVSVDFAKPGAPRVRPSLSFPLYDEENLIGRKNSAIKPTVAIDDEAISKRHALIIRQADGSYLLRDINSTNGTMLNGLALIAGEDKPLKEGDVITLGEFTVITVQAIRAA